ncbi:MAG: hypothetical protein IT158_20795 [Bryobacterales bacterium]|nr:hypothetical protein [Bryobacterales bacterium]
MLPLLLAGPILRRTEPALITVWLALSEPRTVEIRIWDGLAQDSSGASLFSTNLPAIQPLSNAVSTVRAGDRLHIAVASFKLAPANALLPGRTYSYNVVLRDDQGGEQDLKSLELLQDGQINGNPHLALGYEPGFLPTFQLPPLELTDLRILHGSCRRITQTMEDGMAWIDDQIREARFNDPLHRPHQLYLTGDQIYADDVPLPLLPQLLARGRELLGNNEFLPTRWPGPGVTYRPADAHHFPPALREAIVISEARFTSTDYHSHLLSFGEYSAMYLFCWSNVLWDINALPTFDEILETLFNGSGSREHFGALLQTRDASDQPRIEPAMLLGFMDALLPSGSGPNRLSLAELRSALKPRDKHAGEPKWRQPLDAGRLTTERLQSILDEVNAEASADGPGRIEPANDQERVWLQEKHQGRRKIHRTASLLTGEQLVFFRQLFTYLQSSWGGLFHTAKSERNLQVRMFYNDLPKVRRALANVPVYMMLDDHEVTDDWNLNPMWKDRIYTNPLGKTVLRNAILAYALFQGWGNDPEYFESGPAAELLGLLPQLFPKDLTTPPASEPPAAERVSVLFGLDGAAKPPIRWNYTVKSARHLLIAIDNRTRRSFVSRIGPPGNIAIAAIPDQIPAGPLDAGIEVAIVLAPLPVVGPPVFDEVVAPLAYRVYDMASFFKEGDHNLKNMPGTNPDAIEAWAFDPKTFEALLKRLEPFRRIVLLSGDVHNGSAQFLSYWKKGDTQPARFVQFTSSGVRNVMPGFLRMVDRSFAVVQRIIRARLGTTRLGWNEKSPPPLNLPAEDGGVPPALRTRLESSPVLIPATGWPEAATFNRPPDWRWRAHVVRDERPHAERPENARPAQLPAGTDAATVEGYRELVARHVKQFKGATHGRQILMANNLGRIRFERTPTALFAVQELFTAHPQAADPKKGELYTLHRVQLAALGDAKIDEPEPTLGGAV